MLPIEKGKAAPIANRKKGNTRSTQVLSLIHIYRKTEVYVVEHGMVKSIKVQNAHLINTDYLSDDINEIYNEYDKLDEIQ